jgi:hypothetical protein
MATLAACGFNGANKHRLHVLQKDPVLRCQPDGLTQTGALDRAGSTDGTGFGATTDTQVVRNFRLTADFTRTANQLSTCAARAGWAVALDPSSRPTFLVLAGHKQFEVHWTGFLRIFIGNDRRHRPSVQLEIDADPV